MIYTILIIVFVLGYIAIALEHNIHVDKAASALITGVVCWALYVVSTHQEPAVQHATETHVEQSHSGTDTDLAVTEHSEATMEADESHGSGHAGQTPDESLLHHLSEIASILFFLLGAMTIVELVDAHEGFAVITDKIKTTNKVKLLWIISILTFFFSAALDNLTTSIVMVSLLRKLIGDQKERWFFAGMVIVAANAGGAWSPIGDVTTTMLWIKGQLPNTGTLITTLILPSMATLLVPLIFLSFKMKGNVKRPLKAEGAEHYTNPTTSFERNLIFFMGVAGLLFVPVFKTVFHLQPFMGMMFSLGVLWVTTELLHKSKNKEAKNELSVISVLQKIDVASVLFFLGILLAVSALQTSGHLRDLAMGLDSSIGTDTATGVFSVNIIIGLLSSIVDNVPLVAAAQGMYETTLNTGGFFSANGMFWQFLAYCAGTGGSALIIGSAAGVAVMGLEKISFGWYLKRISLLAILGYFAGAAVFILMHM